MAFTLYLRYSPSDKDDLLVSCLPFWSSTLILGVEIRPIQHSQHCCSTILWVESLQKTEVQVLKNNNYSIKRTFPRHFSHCAAVQWYSLTATSVNTAATSIRGLYHRPFTLLHNVLILYDECSFSNASGQHALLIPWSKAFVFVPLLQRRKITLSNNHLKIAAR